MISSLCLWQIWAYHTLCFTYGLHICGIINIHHGITNILLNLLKERTFCKWYIKEILQKTVVDTRITIPLLEASQILKFKDMFVKSNTRTVLCYFDLSCFFSKFLPPQPLQKWRIMCHCSWKGLPMQVSRWIQRTALWE